MTNLTRHKKAIHGGNYFTCERCGESFNRKDVLKRHIKKHSQEKTHQCQHCSRKFYRHDKCLEHQKLCEFEKFEEHREGGTRKYPEGEENGEQRVKQSRWDDATTNTTTEGNNVHSGEDTGCSENPCAFTTAVKDSLKTFKFKPRIQEKYDLSKLLYGKKESLVNRLSQELKAKRGLKWFVSVQVKLIKPKADGSDEISEPHFRSLCMTTVNDHEIKEQLGEANQKILSAFSTYQKKGSGWTLSEILHLDLNVAQYKPLKGSSYLPLPKKLKDKKAIINVENRDNKCFMWRVLAALDPIPRKSNPERIHHYRPYVDEENVDGIECFVPVSKIPKFEKKNKISVNLFGFEEGDLFPLYLTKEREFPVHVNLLLFSRGKKRHYCLIN